MQLQLLTLVELILCYLVRVTYHPTLSGTDEDSGRWDFQLKTWIVPGKQEQVGHPTLGQGIP